MKLPFRLTLRNRQLTRPPVAGRLKRIAPWATWIVAWLGIAVPAAPPTTTIHSGVWIGDVILRAATHARTGVVEATPNPAQMRLLLHVDGAGKVRLLKEVILAQPDLSAPPGLELLVFSDPARMAGKPVATDASRGGAANAQRLATVTYDFKDTDGTADNALDLVGTLGAGKSLQGTLLLDPRHPTNPFRHKFHPDHANEGVNAYEISRALRIDFAGDPETVDGIPQIQGSYSETFRGLHRADLVVQGTVLLKRLSPVAVLNP